MIIKKLVIYGLTLLLVSACSNSVDENNPELMEEIQIENDMVGETNSEFVICCPYCMAQITEITTFCSHCELDTRKDAPLEMSSYDYSNMETKTCISCTHEIPKDAFYCMHCKEKTE